MSPGPLLEALCPGALSASALFLILLHTLADHDPFLKTAVLKFLVSKNSESSPLLLLIVTTPFPHSLLVPKVGRGAATAETEGQKPETHIKSNS